MKVYKLTNRSFIKEITTLCTSSVFSGIIYFSITTGALRIYEGLGNSHAIASLLFFSVVIIYLISIFEVYKINKERYTSFNLEISEDGIEIKQGNVKKAATKYSEIDSISEVTNLGIYIYKSTSKDFVFIPISLDGYNDVKEHLNKISAFNNNSKKQYSEMIKMILICASIVGFRIVLFSQVIWIVLPISVVLIGGFIWSFKRVLISSNIEKKLKVKFLPIILILVLFLILKLLFIIKIFV